MGTILIEGDNTRERDYFLLIETDCKKVADLMLIKLQLIAKIGFIFVPSIKSDQIRHKALVLNEMKLLVFSIDALLRNVNYVV